MKTISKMDNLEIRIQGNQGASDKPYEWHPVSDILREGLQRLSRTVQEKWRQDLLDGKLIPIRRYAGLLREELRLNQNVLTNK